MKCIVLCAGGGSRMGSGIPKALLPIRGKPLLRHVVEMWDDIADSFIFVVGYRWKEVIEYLPDNSKYVIQETQRGIADAILKIENLIEGDERFVVALGDCIQKGIWVIPEKENWTLGVGVWRTTDEWAIRNSYSVEVKDGYITKVVEKPIYIPNNYCGMGTYFFDGRVFDYIRTTPASPLRDEIEITDTIQLMINSEERVVPVFFNGRYLNINYPDDLIKAEELLG